MAQAEGKHVVATHRKARFHYEILEEHEAGLALRGPEVKSLRAGRVSLEGSFGRIDGGEALLHNLHIAPYAHNTSEQIPPDRTRKLLLRRNELERLRGRQDSGGGLTLIPLEIYFRRGWAKVLLGLARARRGPDKRESIRRKAVARELERSFKGRFRA